VALNRRHWAGLGLLAQFLALIRILAEYLRLEHAGGASFTAAAGRVWVIGALITAILSLLGVAFFYFRRYVLVIATAILTVIVLLVYKGVTIGY
jgi:hypothetical protein